MKSRTPRIILLFVAVAAVAAVAFTLINRANVAGQARPIDTVRATRGALVEHITGTGSFKATTTATMAARVSGQVVSIPVTEGDRVAKGELLVQIDPSDYRIAVEQARSALESARRGVRQSLVTLRASYRSALTARDQAQRSYDKNKELFAGKAISGDALKASEDALTTASVNLQSAGEQLNLRMGRPLASQPKLDSGEDGSIVEASPEVAQARVSLEGAEENLAKCTVRALSAGTVTSVVPKVGDLVAQNSPLVTVEDLSAVYAEVQIDEVDIGKIAVGNSAEITSDSLIGTTLKGRVTSIAPTIATVGSTRVSAVKLSIDGSELRTGASCSVKITTQTKENVLNIPLTAFQSRGGKELVYLLVPVDGAPSATTPTASPSAGSVTPAKRGSRPAVYRLEERTITTGISTIDSIEVTSGLTEGELIASGALTQLRPKMLVVSKGAL